MGDTSIAQDILDGVTDALADLGTTRTFRMVAYGSVNPSSPGVAPTETTTDADVEAILFDFDIKWMPDSSVKKGKTLAMIDINGFTAAQLAGLKPGSFLVDGSTEHTIAKVRKIEVAGILVAVILQLED